MWQRTLLLLLLLPFVPPCLLLLLRLLLLHVVHLPSGWVLQRSLDLEVGVKVQQPAVEGEMGVMGARVSARGSATGAGCCSMLMGTSLLRLD